MKKILLIEDNQHIRENTAEILELANYTVHVAENGKTGVEIALQEKPDLIVCDIMMPVLDGYGVLHLLHKNADLRNTPFIFLTAKAERTDMRKAMEMGADDYLTKPFEATELLNAIETRLRKTDMLRQVDGTGLAGMDALMQIAKGATTLESFASDRDTMLYRKKHTIYQEGNRPSRLYFVQKGKVKTYKTNEDGKEFIVGLYQEGDFLGHVALLEGSNYKETAAALEDAELALIPRHDFEELMSSNREIAQKFITLLAKNITDMEEQLVRVAYYSLRKKVAHALTTLFQKYKGDIKISRENLATLAGTATESLIRTLSDFKSEHLIDIQDGTIKILNESKLQNLTM
ncbi:response regulator [Paraflavitalea soli]|uniref:Response regulator n=1 Tax=Paraflavitalea soli TaxID=2315862 RepID=A0A3B7N9T4_9BACT|nr:response regulator [Paraflavitalea soli]AXY78581.1 response regulator [Paraflavitalea soli]